MVVVLEKKNLVHEYPECFHRVGDICLYGSKRTGRACWVNEVFCKFLCAAKGGPCNKECDGNEPKVVFKKMFGKSMPFLNSLFIEKILKKYFGTFEIAVPKMWELIKESFQPILDEFNDCLSGILITGSLMIVDAPLKDMDILLEVKNEKLFGQKYDEIMSKIPKTVNNITVDCFFCFDKHKSFFMMMNPDKREVYTSELFEPSIVNSDEFNIVSSNNTYYADGFIAMVEFLYEYNADTRFIIDEIERIKKVYGEEVVSHILDLQAEYRDSIKALQKCYSCEYYRNKCNGCSPYCLWLTRQKNLIEWLKNGNACPLENKAELQSEDSSFCRKKKMCTECKYYVESGDMCLYLTRTTNLDNWIKQDNACPLNKF